MCAQAATGWPSDDKHIAYSLNRAKCGLKTSSENLGKYLGG